MGSLCTFIDVAYNHTTDTECPAEALCLLRYLEFDKRLRLLPESLRVYIVLKALVRYECQANVLPVSIHAHRYMCADVSCACLWIKFRRTNTRTSTEHTHEHRIGELIQLNLDSIGALAKTGSLHLILAIFAKKSH